MSAKVAVVGAGVVGLATTAALLESDVDVTCFDRLGMMAERSAGESRIFRLAHRDADLVDLARRSRELFARWEDQAHEESSIPLASSSRVLAGICGRTAYVRCRQ